MFVSRCFTRSVYIVSVHVCTCIYVPLSLVCVCVCVCVWICVNIQIQRESENKRNDGEVGKGRFFGHIKCRTSDDRFPLSLWEVWFGSTLGVPMSTLIGHSQCDWVVHRLGGILGSVGHRVKIHKITPTTGKESGDLEIKDYVVLQKPQEHDDRLPSPRTLILDFTLTHTSYGSSHVHTTGQLTNTRSSDDDPEFDGALREVDRKKILHYRQLYINCPDPIVLLPLQLILQVDYTMTSVVYYS